MKKFLSHKALLFAMVMLVLAPVISGAAEIGEYQVKAAMVYNMLKFVDWPNEALPPQASSLNVCVQGKGAFVPFLEPLRGREAKGRHLAVRQIAKNDDLSSCQVLVFTDADKRAMAPLLESVSHRNILTVSDGPRFTSAGGIVGFYEDNGRVKFEINLGAAQRSRIKISSQLLNLAKIVREE